MQAGSVCYLFDVIQASNGAMQYLRGLLEDPGVMKVVHDCRQDSVALSFQKGIKLNNIFDTQVCAFAGVYNKNCRLWQQEYMSVSTCRQSAAMYAQ